MGGRGGGGGGGGVEGGGVATSKCTFVWFYTLEEDWGP